MNKSLHSRELEIFQDVLKEMRHNTGLNQIKLSKRLKKPQSFVSRYEAGERCLDFLELRQVCEALDTSILEFARRFEKVLRKR